MVDITTKELAKIISNLFCASDDDTARLGRSTYTIAGRNEFVAALANHVLRNLSFSCITELCIRACTSRETMDLLDSAAKDVRIAVSKIKKGEAKHETGKD